MNLEIRLNLNITINLETLLLTWNLTRKHHFEHGISKLETLFLLLKCKM